MTLPSHLSQVAFHVYLQCKLHIIIRVYYLQIYDKSMRVSNVKHSNL